MKTKPFDALTSIHQVLGEARQKTYRERAQQLLQKKQPDARELAEQNAARIAREAQLSAEQRATRIAEERRILQQALSRPLIDILDENERLARTCEQQQALLAGWMVSQMQFKDLACAFGEALGIPSELLIDHGLKSRPPDQGR